MGLEVPNTEVTKTCRGPCGRTLSLRDFEFKDKARGLYKGKCATCLAAQKRAQYAKDPQHFHQLKREWLQRNPGKASQYGRTWYERHPVLALLKSAKQRAAKLSVPFELTDEDLTIPEHCPYLGIRLEISRGVPCDASPTVDRIIPTLGYVRDNVEVISIGLTESRTTGPPTNTR